MWLIGAISNKELVQIKKQGWQIDRVIKPNEWNKFIAPKCKSKAEPDSEKLVAVYVDNNISEMLLKMPMKKN